MQPLQPLTTPSLGRKFLLVDLNNVASAPIFNVDVDDTRAFAVFLRLPHFAAPEVSLQGTRLTSEEQECLTAYTSALSGAITGAKEMVDPLRGLLHADVTIADEVWSRTLEVAWATFSDRKRVEFSGVAGSLLAKPWHTKAMNLPPLMQGSHSVSTVCAPTMGGAGDIRSVLFIVVLRETGCGGTLCGPCQGQSKGGSEHLVHFFQCA